MSERESDLKMLNELLDEHLRELDDRETEAFASMRFDMTAYGAGNRGHQETLTDKQRWWVKSAYERIVPDYANLVSQGLVPKGIVTAESRALDAMLARPKVLKPPPRRRDDE